MESSSSNSKETELQQMQLDERELHQKCLALFEKLKKHLGFSPYLKWEPVNYRHLLLWYLEELEKLIDERVLKYAALRMKGKEVQAIQEIERRLQDNEMQKQESLITEGATIEACLVIEGAALEDCLVNEGITVNDNTGVTERNDVDHNIGSSYDSDTVTKAPHSSNDTFQNVFAHGIQSHEQLESIPDTYKVNENNSNIISDIPNMNPDRNKEEHDDVDYEQQRSFFPSLINNLKCDVEKCNEIKLLNDEISYLKSQACEKDKTFAKENEKYDELRKVGQTDQTLRMLLPKDDNVQTGKHGLGFENQNDNVNPSVLNKAKELGWFENIIVHI
ncbi:hypothetical protein Tco_1025015 [Tanacetum coccineum]